MQPVFECQANQDGLSVTDIDNIVDIMRRGGLCILPSDSSYVLTGLITIPGITADINRILNRNDLQMSVCFHSIEQVHKTIELTNLAYNFIKKLTPGGLTFVVSPNSQTLAGFFRRLYIDDGTVGLRISESPSETQLAKTFPIPSTPIRDSTFREISDSDTALKYISEQMRIMNINRDIALVKGEVLHPGELSTVVKEKIVDGFFKIEILREGVIPIDEIEKVAYDCFYDGITISL